MGDTNIANEYEEVSGLKWLFKGGSKDRLPMQESLCSNAGSTQAFRFCTKVPGSKLSNKINIIFCDTLLTSFPHK